MRNQKTNKSILAWITVLTGILLSLAPDLLYALPQKVLYQGTLRRSGTIFTGNGTFLFRVTDATGASEYWTSGSTVVAVTGGLFRYPLGVDNLGGTGLNSKPFANIPWALIEPYVEVTVDGILLSPREPLSSVPYALYFTTGEAFSVGGATFAVAYGKVGIGTTNPQTSLDIQGGHLTIGPTGGNSYNVRFSTRGLVMFNNAFANLGSGANVGGLGFINAGQSHGQFHYRARKGFEHLDVSADAPAIDHLSAAFAPLHAGALVIGGLDESRYNLYTGPADGATIAGNVGIGTTLPQGRLEVRPDAASNYSLFVSSQDASAILTVDKAGDVLIGNPAKHDTTASSDLFVEGNVVIDGQFISHSASGSSVTFTSAGDFVVGTSTLVVTSGKVGIGATNPAAPLEVLSSGIESARITRTSGNTYLRIGRPGIAADDNAIVAWDDTAKQLQLFVSGEGNGSVLNIANGGNVGVGTTNPNTKLQTGSHTRGEGALGYMQAQGVIETQGTSPGSYANLAGYNGILLRHNSWGAVATDPGKRFILYLENSNGDLRFAHDGFGTAMTITQTANVGIGTTIPAATLDVNGSAQFGSGANRSTFTSTGNLEFPLEKEVRFRNDGRLIYHGPSAVEGLWLENFVGGKRNYVSAPGGIILGTGNVGITGGSLTAMNPAALLHVTSGTVLIDGNAATSFKIGTSTLVVNGSGNVGVGTASPEQRLHLNGSNANSLNYLLMLQHGDGANTGTAVGILFSENSIDANRGKGALVYEADGTGFDRGKFHFLQNSVGDTSQAVLSNAVMTIQNNGNVGIGTTNPAATLDVAGTGAFKMPTGTTAQRPASPVAGMMRFNSGNASVEYYNGISWMTAVALSTPPAASGGTETTIVEDGIPYKIHTFTASGSLTVTSPGFVEILVVAGGGSGGNHNTTNGNGGGGGGGVVYRKSFPVTTAGSPYAVTVGAGGAAIGFQVVSRGNTGGDSVFSTLTAKGGGGGGSTGVGAHAYNGGSGGGGGAVNGAFGGGASNQTGGYGNQGGRSYVGWTGGGGGGAGSVGNAVTIAPNSPPDGNGGRGMGFTISGSLVYYAGGGGGGGNSSERAGDGYDGGGRGFGTTAANDYNTYPVGTNATTGGSTTLHALANTGGGGGGGSYWSNNSTGWAGSQGSGAGGSGIVIVRYRLLQ